MKGFKAIIGNYKGFSQSICYFSLCRRDAEKWLIETRKDMTNDISEIEDIIIAPFPTTIVEVDVEKYPMVEIEEKGDNCEECGSCKIWVERFISTQRLWAVEED